MHPDSRYFSFNELSHGNFNVIEGMIPGLLRTNNVQSWSRGGKEAQIGYEAICEIVMAYSKAVFFDEDMKSFDEQVELLNDEMPLGVMEISIPYKN